MHNHIPGPSDSMTDDSSRLFNLTDSQCIDYFNDNYPQVILYKLVTIPLSMSSNVISTLQSKMHTRKYLLVYLAQPHHIGENGRNS